MPSEAEVQEYVDHLLAECMEDPDALSCAIEMLEAIPKELEVCKPELLFLTRPDCPVCEEDREKYGDLIKQGIVREVQSESEEGQRVMDLNNLEFTPTLALVTCEGKLIGEFHDSNVVEGEDIA